ncbi:WD40-repeat-containing domain protein [Coprinopsis sp. MPI-PUGE-AT-0042]|nr:WD40-repeat-containing domain protein [Coprinopsis sp. MPI-PUGE-AT-0042]
MAPSDRTNSSDDDEYENEQEDEGLPNSEPGDYEVEAEEGSDADDGSDTDDSDSDDDEDDEPEPEPDVEVERDDEDEMLQKELQETLEDFDDSELRDLETSAAALPSASSMDAQMKSLEDEDSQQSMMSTERGATPGSAMDTMPPSLDIPLLDADEYHQNMTLHTSPTPPAGPLPAIDASPRSVTMASPPRRPRSPSPATRRHYELFAPIGTTQSTSRFALNGTALPPSDSNNPPVARTPRSYAVEAICAMPHPTPTHSLAASYCMTHLITGSDDGYVRNYDIYTAVNGKTFLSQPQRQHAGVVEGLFKSGQIRSWWENPAASEAQKRVGIMTSAMPSVNPQFSHVSDDGDGLAPVYSMIMHSDAIWALAGSDTGHINLFTVRHEPGRLIHVMEKHRGPVSAMAMDHDEKGFFSAGWDGEALQWDLNTGKNVRNFAAHGAQLAAIALRPAFTGQYVDPTASGSVVYKRKERDKKPKYEKQEEEDVDGDEQMGTVNPDTPAPASSAPFTSMDVSMDYGEGGSMTTLGSLGPTGSTPQPPQDVSLVKQEQGSGEPPADPTENEDAKSDGSFDPLFDEEGEEGDDTQKSSNTAPPPAEPAHSNTYTTLSFNANPNAPPPPPVTNTGPKPIVPGAPQNHFVTFPLNVPGPGAGQDHQPPNAFFQAGVNQAQGGQTFSFQLAKPPQPKKGAAADAAAKSTTAPKLQPAPRMPASTNAMQVDQPRGIAPPKNAPPLLEPMGYQTYSSDLLMTAFVDGQVVLWDRRVSSPGRGVGRLWMSEKTPPWCLSACWSLDGGQIYAGRRNGTIDVWDVRLMGASGPNNIPRLVKTIRNPPSSGVVSCVVPFPDCRHIACASVDNIRLWNVAEAGTEDTSMARPKGGVLFKIIPGHHGGYISQIRMEPFSFLP